ncbi:MAG TPA: hypothetical protein VF718_10665 [Allosphingosinicella sp.]
MRWFAGLCAAGLAFWAAQAPAAAAGITYDCDTAADHFSELVLPAPGASFVVAGTVQLRALARSKTYAPIARLQIATSSASGQSPEGFAGFTLTALPTDSKKSTSEAVQMLGYNANGREDETVPLSVMTRPGTAQPFNLSYDGSQVVVNLGNEARTFPLKAAEPVVRILCSTGEFLFTDLVIKPR